MRMYLQGSILITPFLNKSYPTPNSKKGGLTSFVLFVTDCMPRFENDAVKDSLRRNDRVVPPCDS